MHEPAEAAFDARPVRRPLPIERLGAFVEVILCSGLPSQLAVVLVLNAFGMRMVDAQGRLSPPFIFVLSLADTVIVVLLVLALLHAHRESPREVLLGNRPALPETLVGLAMTPAVFIGVLLVMVALIGLWPQLHNVPRNPLEEMLRTRGDAIIFGVVVMLAGGVREEVQRGFIVHRFRGFLGGARWGIGLYSAAFGFGHLEQGYDAVVATALLGACWGIVYAARGSIVAPVVSHAGFNMAQLLKFLALR